MSEWWTYRLRDFLLFTPRTYFRQFELLHREVWPAQVFALLAGLAVLVFLLRRRPWSDRAAAVLLAAGCAWTGWAFLLERYAAINWAARWFAWAFFVEAGLLGWNSFRSGRGGRPVHGAALFAWALLLHPLLGLAAGRTWAQLECFGLTPDATAIAAIGFALVMGSRLLLVVPLLWCAFSGATLLAMHSPEAWATFGAGVMGVWASFRRG